MVEQWKELRGYLDKALRDRDRIWTKVFEAIETRIGVDRVNVALIMKVFVVIYLVVGRGREFVCNLIGFVYPAYASIKAIETKEKDDDTKWLTYWVVYAAFALIEFFSDYFLSWLPFYWLLKCLFLIVCMLPFSRNGSIFIYRRIIRPIFLKHQNTIDSAVDTAAEAGGSLVDEATGRKKQKLRGKGDKDGDAKDTEAGAEERPPPAAFDEDNKRKGVIRRRDKERNEEDDD